MQHAQEVSSHHYQQQQQQLLHSSSPPSIVPFLTIVQLGNGLPSQHSSELLDKEIAKLALTSSFATEDIDSVGVQDVDEGGGKETGSKGDENSNNNKKESNKIASADMNNQFSGPATESATESAAHSTDPFGLGLLIKPKAVAQPITHALTKSQPQQLVSSVSSSSIAAVVTENGTQQPGLVTDIKKSTCLSLTVRLTLQGVMNSVRTLLGKAE